MSDYLNDLIKRAQAGGNSDLWDDVTPEGGDAPALRPTERNAVKRDSFDRLNWDMVCDQAPVLREHMVELSVDYDTSPDAYEDLFNLLHQGDPRFVPEAQVVDTHKPQRILLESAAEGDEFQLLRKETRYDEYSTAFAMATMKGAMREMFDSIKDAIEQAQAAQQALEDALEQAEQAQADGQGQDGAAEALQAALDGQQQAQQAGQDAAATGVQDLAEAMSKAGEQVRSENQTLDGWGQGDSDELKRMSFEERRALAERLNQDKLKRMAALVGQWRMYADAERRHKVKHVPEEVVSITMGNDLTKLTVSEMTNLAIPEIEDMFWIRWARHGLLQKEVRGVDKEGKGPIIVVCDESMSMNSAVDAEGNTREMWSKAVSLALCDAAKRDGRDFTYIGFASANQQWQIDFPGGQVSLTGVIEFAEHFFAGNTSYPQPLTRAMDIIKTYDQAGKPKPDIVFITDDNCRVTSEFLAEWRETKERTDARCYGIQIGGDPYKNNLKDIADHCMQLSKLNSNPEGVRHIFRTV